MGSIGRAGARQGLNHWTTTLVWTIRRPDTKRCGFGQKGGEHEAWSAVAGVGVVPLSWQPAIMLPPITKLNPAAAYL